MQTRACFTVHRNDEEKHRRIYATTPVTTQYFKKPHKEFRHSFFNPMKGKNMTKQILILLATLILFTPLATATDEITHKDFQIDAKIATTFPFRSSHSGGMGLLLGSDYGFLKYFRAGIELGMTSLFMRDPYPIQIDAYAKIPFDVTVRKMLVRPYLQIPIGTLIIMGVPPAILTGVHGGVHWYFTKYVGILLDVGANFTVNIVPPRDEPESPRRYSAFWDVSLQMLLGLSVRI